MKKISCVVLATSCLLSVAFADPSYPVPAGQSQIGRYLTISNAKPLDMGLSQVVQVKIPNNIQTIGDALSMVLRGTGYQLLAYEDSDRQIQSLYSLPLPDEDRDLNPMALQDLLSSISGDEYQIIVDPVNRLISFRLSPELAQFYSVTTPVN